jgi:hypothetical protein
MIAKINKRGVESLAETTLNTKTFMKLIHEVAIPLHDTFYVSGNNVFIEGHVFDIVAIDFQYYVHTPSVARVYSIMFQIASERARLPEYANVCDDYGNPINNWKSMDRQLAILQAYVDEKDFPEPYDDVCVELISYLKGDKDSHWHDCYTEYDFKR